MIRLLPSVPILALAALPVASLAQQPRPDADAEVWHRAVQVSIQLQNDGMWESHQTWEVRADTDLAARAAADQTFGFSTGLEDVRVAEAYTRKADGTIIPIANGAVVDQGISAAGDYPSFSDWQTRTIVFPDVQAGDTVHYVLDRRSKITLFPGIYETMLDIGPRANVSAADISITAPAAMSLTFSVHGLDTAPPITSDALITRTWHLAASDMPGSRYVEFEASTFPDYLALGNAFAARALPAAAPTPEIAALADKLTEGVTSRRDQAERLYDFVARKIRYVGMQFGAGRVVPHAAASVLHAAYGDCKDHVALLQALLAAKGIFSEPALISMKSRYTLPPAPTLSLLDHVVTFIPEFDVYLDSTSPYASFGVLPFEDYDKPVVLAGAGGAHLARTPPLPEGLAVTETTTDADIAADGSVSGETITHASGPAAISLRETASALEDSGTESAAADELRRLGTPGDGDFAFSPPLETASGYQISGDFRLEETTAATDGAPFPIPAGLPALIGGGAFLVSSKPASHGGHLCYAGRQVEILHLRLPDGASVKELPRNISAAGGFARYQAQYATAADAIDVHRELVVTAPHPLCSDAEYEAMEPALRAARRDMHAQIALGAPVIASGAEAPAGAEAATGCGQAGNACREAGDASVAGTVRSRP